MPRLEGTVPLKFGGVVIGRASLMQSDETGLTVNLFLDGKCKELTAAIIELVRIDALPSMSFSFDEPTERVNDCAD